MKKIILIASMAVVILAQVFVLGHFFIDRYSIVLGGDKFKFLVHDLDLSKAKDKGYIDFKLKKNIVGQGEYGILRIDEEGFAELSNVVLQMPNFGAYILNSENGYFKFPYSRYYLNDVIEYDEKLALTKDYKAYINVRIKEGKVELMDLIVDGEKIESYIE
ncbi:MAG: hypothetical protein E7314_00395 [Clostridiales bacterium]|nr:hypothetical protein [Clostridiales bacterium]